MKVDCVCDNGNDYYFLVVNNKLKTDEICSDLNIAEKEYIKILQNYKAILIEDLYFFNSYEEATICLKSEELMPYLMFKEMTT